MIFRVLACLLGFAAFVSLRADESAAAAPSAPTAAAAAAGLEFAAREISLVAKPGDEELEAEFVFVNRADRAVFVEEVRASCGCTVPSLEKTTYASGEQGRVRVVFSVGARVGPQRLSIKVHTDAGEHELVLRVDIPPRVTFSPRLLLFRGGEAGEKIARVTYHAATPVTLQEPRNPGDAFAVTVREIEAGREFEITARYVGDAEEARTFACELRSRDSGGREHADRLYLRHAP